MNVKIFNKSRVYTFIVNLNEENFIDWRSFTIDNSDHMSLVSFIQSDLDTMIRLENYGRVVVPPKKVFYLIKKYGLISHNKYPMKPDDMTYIYKTLLELVSLYMYDSVKYSYVEENKHVYDIKTGEEVEFGSQKWDDIRNPNYYNVVKGTLVGESLSLYFDNCGYKRKVSPSGFFCLNTSNLE